MSFKRFFVAALLTTALAAPSVAVKPTAKAPRVKIVTTMGDITVELYPDKAPISVKNFLSYVDDKFYDGTIFHRVISSFMIQGGGFTSDMTKKPTKPPIALEVGKGLSNLRGTLAMARTRVKDSATAQFFINVVDNKRLDTAGGGYAVFGKVISGLESVDKIKAVPTTQKKGMANVPVDAVTIKSVRKL